MSDEMIDITDKSHLFIYVMLDTISHDAGMGGGHATYAVDARFAPELEGFECLAETIGAEGLLDTFCIGEVSEQDAIAERHKAHRLHLFLNVFFGEAEWVAQ